MNLNDAPPLDVRAQLTGQRARLLSLLESLTAGQCAAATAAPGWSVKDVALHLLDVDLSWLARKRDEDASGHIPLPGTHEGFVAGLGARNQRWVDGARALSPRLVTDLLRWAGEQLDAYLATLDLGSRSSAYWAGDAPTWFDLGFQQIREAAFPGTPVGDDEFLPLVIRVFVWGYPHQSAHGS